MGKTESISIDELLVGMFISEPVYVLGTRQRKAMLLAGNTLVTDESLIRRLVNAGAKSVTIDIERGLDPAYIGDTIDEIEQNVFERELKRDVEKSNIISNSLLDQRPWEDIVKSAQGDSYADVIVSKFIKSFLTMATKIIFSNVTSKLFMKEDIVQKIIKQIFRDVGKNIDILRAIIKLNELNEYTLVHSVNTMVLTVSLANSLDYSLEETKKVGIAVLLADLGMSNFNKRLINRPTELSETEMAEINRHSLFTVKFIRKFGIEDPFIDNLIIQHHERFDGSGYPNGLKGDEIDGISRLFAIADVYDAMTSFRPYREALPPYIALVEILKLSKTLFDPELTKNFIKHIGLFPIGSMVELTSGCPALVSSSNSKDPLKPIVIIFMFQKFKHIEDEESYKKIGLMIKRCQWELVDLAANNENDYGKIKRGLDHRKYKLDPAHYLNQV